MPDINTIMSRFIDEILKDHPLEDEITEYKSNLYFKHDTDFSIIGKYICALANSAVLKEAEKAYFIIGISDSGEIIGTDFDPRVKLPNHQNLEHWLTQKLSRNCTFTTHIVTYTSQAPSQTSRNPLKVVIFEIDAPRAYPVEWDGIRYFRLGSSQKELRHFPEYERLLWQKLSRTKFTEIIALNHLSAEKVVKLLDLDSYFALLNLKIPSGLNGQLEQFMHEGYLRKDAHGYSITNLGAILFARDLDAFPTLKHKKLRIAIYLTDHKAGPSTEIRCPEGYACGFNLFELRIADKFKHSEIVSDITGLRVPYHEFPMIAIREILANCLIHQDMNRSEAPLVEIFPSRIVFTNPGRLRLPVLRIIDQYNASSNPEMVAFMEKCHICESRGTGVDKAIIDCEKSMRNAPAFEEAKGENETVRVTVYPHTDFNAMSSIDRMRACYQHCCICYLGGKTLMTNSSLRTRFKLGTSDASKVSRVIKSALEAGYIKIENSDAGVKNRKYIPFWALPSEKIPL